MRHHSLSIAVIGAGPVGTALALRCQAAGHRITAVVSRRAASARQLARRVGCGLSGTRVRIIPSETDLVLIAVPDDSIERIAVSLASTVAWHPHTGFVHTSGPMTSDALAPLRALDRAVASVHPIQSFSRHSSAREIGNVLDGVWWGVECQPSHRRWAHRLVRSWGGKPFQVPKEAKIVYHLACTFAANYPVLLWALAAELGKRARVPKGMEPFVPLILTSLRNSRSVGPVRALTGPAVRGDRNVLAKHRKAVRRLAPGWLRLFDLLVVRARSVSAR